MNSNKLIFGLAALLVGAVACGGSVVVTGGTGGTGTGTGTTGTGATTGTGTSSSGSPCPSAQPTGAACAGVPSGFRCTYGTDTRPECREVATCLNGQWESPGTACAMSTACGVSQPAAGSVCSQDGSLQATCSYGSTICLCDSCANGPCMAPPITWQCAGAPTTAGCPPVVPNDGTTCGAEGTTCSYGFVCGPSGAQVTCTQGLWHWETMITCAG